MDPEIAAVHYFLRKRRFNEAIHTNSKHTGYALQETLQFWRAAALVFGGAFLKTTRSLAKLIKDSQVDLRPLPSRSSRHF